MCVYGFILTSNASNTRSNFLSLFFILSIFAYAVKLNRATIFMHVYQHTSTHFFSLCFFLFYSFSFIFIAVFVWKLENVSRVLLNSSPSLFFRAIYMLVLDTYTFTLSHQHRSRYSYNLLSFQFTLFFRNWRSTRSIHNTYATLHGFISMYALYQCFDMYAYACIVIIAEKSSESTSNTSR